MYANFIFSWRGKTVSIIYILQYVSHNSRKVVYLVIMSLEQRVHLAFYWNFEVTITLGFIVTNSVCAWRIIRLFTLPVSCRFNDPSRNAVVKLSIIIMLIKHILLESNYWQLTGFPLLWIIYYSLWSGDLGLSNVLWHLLGVINFNFFTEPHGIADVIMVVWVKCFMGRCFISIWIGR